MEMLKQPETDISAQLVRANVSISGISTSTSGCLTLAPVTITIPGEILAIIAEACVEPYSIEINENEANEARPLAIVHRPAAEELATVSRDFEIGVKKGLRHRFNGHIITPVIYKHEVHDVLSKNDLEWVLPDITCITLLRLRDRNWGIRETPSEKDCCSIYPNLKRRECCVATSKPNRCSCPGLRTE